jgi:hypothetical protein
VGLGRGLRGLVCLCGGGSERWWMMVSCALFLGTGHCWGDDDDDYYDTFHEDGQ